MSVQTIIRKVVNLDEPVLKRPLRDVLGSHDDQAHRFEAVLKRGNETLDISAAVVIGYFIRADGETVMMTGGVENGAAYVVLAENCYYLPGHFNVIVKVQVGDVRHTVLWYEGTVGQTSTDTIIDPESVVPSLEDLLAKISEMEAATESANTAAEAANEAREGIQEDLSQLSEEISNENKRAVLRENEIEALFTTPTQEAVDNWLNAHPEATTTVQDKSLTIDKMVVGTLGYVTPEMFGAVGDGVTDDTEAIQKAIDSLTDGGTLLFRDVENYYKLTKSIGIRNKKRIRIINGKFDNSGNTSQVGFAVSNSDTVIFANCEFYKGQQLILLYTCENIFVDKCTFIETGYCIIQQNGYVSNNVNITNNRALNTKNDFIECNCEINAPSENWVITGNIYKRDLDDITNAVEECRFFGATECKNIVISSNLIEGARGDSAIHFEDCGDNVIVSNNIIRNCNGFGYITFMTSRKVLIANNIFENETELDVPFIFATYSDLSTSREDIDKIVISGNMFNGNKTQTDPLHVYSLNDDVIIEGNIFNDIDIVFKEQRIQHLTFRNNIVHCNKFIENIVNSTLQSIFIYDALFANNKIHGTTVITANYNGITCKRLKFCNNIFYNDVSIKDAENCIFNDNMIAKGKTLLFEATSYYARHMYAYNNFVVDGGKIADALPEG